MTDLQKLRCEFIGSIILYSMLFVMSATLVVFPVIYAIIYSEYSVLLSLLATLPAATVVYLVNIPALSDDIKEYKHQKEILEVIYKWD